MYEHKSNSSESTYNYFMRSISGNSRACCFSMDNLGEEEMKPREFWITTPDQDSTGNIYLSPDKQCIHVIEYSAYEAEQKKNHAKRQLALDLEHVRQVNSQLREEISKLRADRNFQSAQRDHNANTALEIAAERYDLQSLLAIREAQLIEKSPDFKDLKAELEQAKATIAEYPASNRVKNENINLKVENEKLKIKIEQHRGALGYSVPGHIPEDRTIKCGLCEAKTNSVLKSDKQNEELRTHIDNLEAALDKVAYMDGATLDHLKQIARTALKTFKDNK